MPTKSDLPAATGTLEQRITRARVEDGEKAVLVAALAEHAAFVEQHAELDVRICEHNLATAKAKRDQVSAPPGGDALNLERRRLTMRAGLAECDVQDIKLELGARYGVVDALNRVQADGTLAR